MDCPNLKLIIGLIKTHTKYVSNKLIGECLGITESTLRHWQDPNRGPLKIPDKKLDAFCDLIVEVVRTQRPLTKESAKKLLQGSILTFHNALLPIGGGSWANLIENRRSEYGLTVVVKQNTNELSFGETDDKPVANLAATVELNQPFYFKSSTPWRGEAVVIAEHLGEWRICPVAYDQRIIRIQGGDFEVPSQSSSPPVNYREKTKAGVYRYFIIAVARHLSDHLREQLICANPLGQLQLDLLADLFLSYEEGSCLVADTTIIVNSTGTKI